MGICADEHALIADEERGLKTDKRAKPGDLATSRRRQQRLASHHECDCHTKSLSLAINTRFWRQHIVYFIEEIAAAIHLMKQSRHSEIGEPLSVCRFGEQALVLFSAFVLTGPSQTERGPRAAWAPFYPSPELLLPLRASLRRCTTLVKASHDTAGEITPEGNFEHIQMLFSVCDGVRHFLSLPTEAFWSWLFIDKSVTPNEMGVQPISPAIHSKYLV